MCAELFFNLLVKNYTVFKNFCESMHGRELWKQPPSIACFLIAVQPFEVSHLYFPHPTQEVAENPTATSAE